MTRRYPTLAALPLLLSPTLALAGDAGSITFTPLAAANAIPVMGGTFLVLTGLLLAIVAWSSSRGNRASPLLLAVLASAALLSTGGGINLIHKAEAGVDPVITSPVQPTTFPVFANSFNSYTNNSGVPVRVTSLTLPAADCLADLSQPDACALNRVLQPGTVCEVDCRMIFSDRRLKTAIRQVGITYNALPLYQFRYLHGDTVYQGVMAQDVLAHTPGAVATMANGYLAVNYRALGLEMTTVN